MKIKGSVEKIKPMHLIVAFVFGLVSCTALRFYHSIKYIDVTNGFYAKTDFTVVLFYVILIAVSLFILVAGFVSGDNRRLSKDTIHSNKLLGISGILLSIGMFIDSIYSSVLSLYSSGGAGAGTDSFTYLMRNGSLPYRLQSLFSFLSFIFFIVFAVNCFRKSGKITSRRIFALMPVGWACTKMIPLFIKQISFIRVSDLILELIIVSFLIAYTLSFAQCLSGIYDEVAQWRLTAVGLVVALFAIVLNLPKLVFTIMGNTEAYVTSGYPVSYAELLFALFALVLIFSMLKKNEAGADTSEEIKELN